MEIYSLYRYFCFCFAHSVLAKYFNLQYLFYLPFLVDLDFCHSWLPVVSAKIVCAKFGLCHLPFHFPGCSLAVETCLLSLLCCTCGGTWSLLFVLFCTLCGFQFSPLVISCSWDGIRSPQLVLFHTIARTIMLYPP